MKKFISDILSVSAKVKKEYMRLKVTDPENAFWVDEVDGWIDSLKSAVDDVW